MSTSPRPICAITCHTCGIRTALRLSLPNLAFPSWMKPHCHWHNSFSIHLAASTIWALWVRYWRASGRMACKSLVSLHGVLSTTGNLGTLRHITECRLWIEQRRKGITRRACLTLSISFKLEHSQIRNIELFRSASSTYIFRISQLLDLPLAVSSQSSYVWSTQILHSRHALQKGPLLQIEFAIVIFQVISETLYPSDRTRWHEGCGPSMISILVMQISIQSDDSNVMGSSHQYEEESSGRWTVIAWYICRFDQTVYNARNITSRIWQVPDIGKAIWRMVS